MDHRRAVDRDTHRLARRCVVGGRPGQRAEHAGVQRVLAIDRAVHEQVGDEVLGRNRDGGDELGEVVVATIVLSLALAPIGPLEHAREEEIGLANPSDRPVVERDRQLSIGLCTRHARLGKRREFAHQEVWRAFRRARHQRARGRDGASRRDQRAEHGKGRDGPEPTQSDEPDDHRQVGEIRVGAAGGDDLRRHARAGLHAEDAGRAAKRESPRLLEVRARAQPVEDELELPAIAEVAGHHGVEARDRLAELVDQVRSHARSLEGAEIDHDAFRAWKHRRRVERVLLDQDAGELPSEVLVELETPRDFLRLERIDPDGFAKRPHRVANGCDRRIAVVAECAEQLDAPGRRGPRNRDLARIAAQRSLGESGSTSWFAAGGFHPRCILRTSVSAGRTLQDLGGAACPSGVPRGAKLSLRISRDIP